MQRGIGAVWFAVGIILLLLGLTWLGFETPLVTAMPVDPRLALQHAPRWGDYLVPMAGIFLAVLGEQLTRGKPGARIVAAFAHAIAALCMFAVAYVVIIRTIALGTSSGFVIAAFVGAFGAFLLYIAVQFYAVQQVDPAAEAWKPANVCERCGRLLDERQRCPVHDVPLLFARLVNESGKTYRIPTPVAVIGTADADVRLDLADDARYRHISQLHAQISLDAVKERFVIKDLQSTNGTRVAEQDIGQHERELPANVTVKLGSVPFKFEVIRRTQEELDAHPGDAWDA